MTARVRAPRTLDSQSRLRLACIGADRTALEAFARWVGRMAPIEVRVFSAAGAEPPVASILAWAEQRGSGTCSDCDSEWTAAHSRPQLALCAYGAVACDATLGMARSGALASALLCHVVLINPGGTAQLTVPPSMTALQCNVLVLAEAGNACAHNAAVEPDNACGSVALPWHDDTAAEELSVITTGQCLCLRIRVPHSTPGGNEPAASAARWLDAPPMRSVAAESPLDFSLSYSAAFEELSRVLCTDHLCLPMHELVLLQARRTPQSPACICGEVTLNFLEFCSAAHAIAQRVALWRESAKVDGTEGKEAVGTGIGSSAREELNAETAADLARLRSAPVRGKRIMLCMAKREQLPIAYMAAYMLRCPVSSIDQRNTPAMIAYQVELWQPALVICAHQADVPDSLPSSVPRIEIVDLITAWRRRELHQCEIDQVASTWCLPPTSVPSSNNVDLLWDISARMNDVAFIEWTSGTTGRPKGAEVTHYGMVHWLFWRWWQFPLVPNEGIATTSGELVRAHSGPFKGGAVDGYVSAMNLFFTWYWHMPLAMGGQLLIIPDEMQMDIMQLPSLIEASGTTRIECLTPSLLRVMLEVCSAEDLHRAFRHVVFVMTSGEALPLDVAELYFQKMPHTARLYNILACTETSSDVVWSELSPQVIRAAMEHVPALRTAPIGQPVWNVSVELRALSKDVADAFGPGYGELCIRAPNINSAGYFRRPELNKEKFPPDEAGENVEGRAVATYCTRDVACWTRLVSADGNELAPSLCVSGRADNCVKVRGHRIEMESVEEVLNAVPGVLDAALAVASNTDDQGNESAGEALVAFVAFKFANQDTEKRAHGASALQAFGDAATQAKIAELISVSRGKLPASHVPDHVISILPEQLEYTVNGKLNRKKLLSIYHQRLHQAELTRGTTLAKASNSPLTPRRAASVVARADHAASSPTAVNVKPPSTLAEWQLHVACAWSDLLPQAQSAHNLAADPGKSFFELGGHSLLAMRLAARLKLPVADLFQHDTLGEQALHMWRQAGGSDGTDTDDDEGGPKSSEVDLQANNNDPKRDIAVIGVAGRFPGAASAAQLWNMLCDGHEGIEDVAEDEMLRAGAPPDLVRGRASLKATGKPESADAANTPHWVSRAGAIPAACITGFDIGFWGWRRDEAETTDPAGRSLLECAYEAVEMAGYDPLDTSADARVSCTVGAQAMSSGVGTYVCAGSLSHHAERLAAAASSLRSAGSNTAPLEELRQREPATYLQLETGCDKDYTATRLAYALGLRGPAVNIHTACSSALVAVVTAVHALRRGECASAIAGGASIQHAGRDGSQRTGYLYQPGMIFSPDGRCRAFDNAAAGTVDTNAAAIVFMKPLHAARAHGDDILAVIRGAATNNDGRRKAAFSAPSIEGQTDVIRAALADAYHRSDVYNAKATPAPVSWLPSPYMIECHGTGTPLGDPIELAALRKAIAPQQYPRGWHCAVGSIKTSVGHANTAAGAVGLMKTVLCLRHRVLLPSLHFQEPNKRAQGLCGQKQYEKHIDSVDEKLGPFVVQTRLSPWAQPEVAGSRVNHHVQRMAGVSSFGVGGTNAHVVLEEHTGDPSTREDNSVCVHDEHFVLGISARTRNGLDDARKQLREALLSAADYAHVCSSQSGAGAEVFEQDINDGLSDDSDVDTSSQHIRSCPKWVQLSAAATAAETAVAVTHRPPIVRLRDIEFTLMCNRRHHEFRAAVVCTVSASSTCTEQLLQAAQALLNPFASAEPSAKSGVAIGHAPVSATGLARNVLARRRDLGKSKPGRPVALMFPGQGAQFDGMGAGLCGCRSEILHCPAYREAFERCGAVLRRLSHKLNAATIEENGFWGGVKLDLSSSTGAQLGVFITSYCTSHSLLSRHGIAPNIAKSPEALVAVLGHSVGEYAAATVSGIFELDIAMQIVAERGRLMDELMHSDNAPCAENSVRPGAMMSLSVGEEDAKNIVDTVLVRASRGKEHNNFRLEIACLNAPRSTVVSGDESAINALESMALAHNNSLDKPLPETSEQTGCLHSVLGNRRLRARRIKTAGAFHSALLDPMLPPFRVFLETLQAECASNGRAFANAPRVPMLSNVSGTWLDPKEAISINYWVRQVRAPVRFSDCIAALQSSNSAERAVGLVLLEAGPGTGCSSLARMTLARQSAASTLSSQEIDVVPLQNIIAIPAMRHPLDVASKADPAAADRRALKFCAAKLWSVGVVINWEQVLHIPGVTARRVALLACPFAYPWQRTHCWPVHEVTKDDAAASKSLQPPISLHIDNNLKNSAFESLWYRVEWVNRPLPRNPLIARYLFRESDDNYRKGLAAAAAAIGVNQWPVLLDGLDAACPRNAYTNMHQCIRARTRLAHDTVTKIGSGMPCVAVPHCCDDFPTDGSEADRAATAAIDAASVHERLIFAGCSSDCDVDADNVGFNSCVRFVVIWQKLQRIAARRGNKSGPVLELWLIVPPSLRYAALWGLAKSAAIEGASSGVLLRRIIWDSTKHVIEPIEGGGMIALELLESAQFAKSQSQTLTSERFALVTTNDGTQKDVNVRARMATTASGDGWNTTAYDAALEEVELSNSRRVPRLIPCGAPARGALASEQRCECNAYGIRGLHAVYLVTGGTRGVGLEVAMRLARRGASALLLVSRSPAAPSTIARLEKLCKVEEQRRKQRISCAKISTIAVPLRVVCVQCDVTDRDAVNTLFAALQNCDCSEAEPPAYHCSSVGCVKRIEERGRLGTLLGATADAPLTLRGVVHCAGTVADRALLRMQPEQVHSVLSSKALGAWHIHLHTCQGTGLEIQGTVMQQREPLDFCIFFSSTASAWGTAGQANYSAANTFLDWLSRERNSGQERRTHAIRWGGWDEVGMSIDLGLDPAPSNGERFLRLSSGLRALERIIGSLMCNTTNFMPFSNEGVDGDSYAVIDVKDWGHFRSDNTLFGDDGGGVAKDHAASGTNIPFLRHLPQSGPVNTSRRTDVASNTVVRDSHDASTATHPLLGLPTLDADANSCVWNRDIRLDAYGTAMADPELAFLLQHRMGTDIVFPGSAYVEMCIAAALRTSGNCGTTHEGFRACVTLTDVQFRRAMILRAPGRELCTVARDGHLEIKSRTIDGAGAWVVHATCHAHVSISDSEARVDTNLSDGEEQYSYRIPGPVLYGQFQESGFNYGPGFSALNDVFVHPTSTTKTKAWGVLRSDSANFDIAKAAGNTQRQSSEEPEAVAGRRCFSPYVTHPALLDAATHTASVVHPAGFGGLPSKIHQVIVNMLPGPTVDKESSHAPLLSITTADRDDTGKTAVDIIIGAAILSDGTETKRPPRLTNFNGSEHWQASTVSILGFEMANTHFAATDSRESALETIAQQQAIVASTWHEKGEVMVNQLAPTAAPAAAVLSTTVSGRWLVLNIGQSLQQVSTHIGSCLLTQNVRDSVLIADMAPTTTGSPAVTCNMKFNNEDERFVTSQHDSVTTALSTIVQQLLHCSSDDTETECVAPFIRGVILANNSLPATDSGMPATALPNLKVMQFMHSVSMVFTDIMSSVKARLLPAARLWCVEARSARHHCNTVSTALRGWIRAGLLSGWRASTVVAVQQEATSASIDGVANAIVQGALLNNDRDMLSSVGSDVLLTQCPTGDGSEMSTWRVHVLGARSWGTVSDVSTLYTQHVEKRQLEEHDMETPPRTLVPAERDRQNVVPAYVPYAVTVSPDEGIAGVRLQRRNTRQWHRASGTLTSLASAFQSFESDPAEVGRVLIATSTWALNFRDVLVAMGVIPSTVAGQDLGIGGECIGIVVAIGPHKKGRRLRPDITPGQRVVALPPDGFGSLVSVDNRFVIALNNAGSSAADITAGSSIDVENLSDADAVGATMAFATAWYGLIELARLKKGERVLIHSAAGGVGLAAVRICHMKGAIVYATCSTEAKRAALREEGVANDRIFNSRGLAFATDIRDQIHRERSRQNDVASTGREDDQIGTCKDGEQTEDEDESTDEDVENAEGVLDIVLNSLAGDAMKASVMLLRSFGRFVEIGKRDQYEGTLISLAPFVRHLQYLTAHLDVLMLRRPSAARSVMLDVWKALAAGQLQPLPSTVFPVQRVRDSLEYMAKGVHIGKVLVSMDGDIQDGSGVVLDARVLSDQIAQKLQRGSVLLESAVHAPSAPRIVGPFSMPLLRVREETAMASEVWVSGVRAVEPSAQNALQNVVAARGATLLGAEGVGADPLSIAVVSCLLRSGATVVRMILRNESDVCVREAVSADSSATRCKGAYVLVSDSVMAAAADRRSAGRKLRGIVHCTPFICAHRGASTSTSSILAEVVEAQALHDESLVVAKQQEKFFHIAYVPLAATVVAAETTGDSAVISANTMLNSVVTELACARRAAHSWVSGLAIALARLGDGTGEDDYCESDGNDAWPGDRAMSWRWQWRHLMKLPRAEFLVSLAAQVSTISTNSAESRKFESLACSPEAWNQTHPEYQAGIEQSTVMDALVAAYASAALKSANDIDSTNGPVIAARVKPQFGAAVLAAPHATQHRTIASAATALLLASIAPAASEQLDGDDSFDDNIDKRNSNYRSKPTSDSSSSSHQTKQLISVLEVQTWLKAMVADQRGISAEEIDSNRPLEEYGFDSLSLISVAHKLRSALGVNVSTVDIFDFPTIALLSQHLGHDDGSNGNEANSPGMAQAQHTSEPKLSTSGAAIGAPNVLVLHGFRTSAELMEMQMRGFVRACSEAMGQMAGAQFSYAQAPHGASGPSEESIPADYAKAQGGLREWWGRWNAAEEERTFLRGWIGPEHDGIDASLEELEGLIDRQGYDAVVGFSQGAAMAALLAARRQQRHVAQFRFCVLFSGVTCAPLLDLCKEINAGSILGALTCPSVHIYDPDEDFASCAKDLKSCFSAADDSSLTLSHSYDHTLPVRPDFYAPVIEYLSIADKS